MANPSTDAQLSYIEGLCKDNGISNVFISQDHETLPHYDQSYARLAPWVKSLTTIEASDVIKYLKDAKNA